MKKNLARAQAEVIIRLAFLQTMNCGDFVLIDDTLEEPKHHIVKQGIPIVKVFIQCDSRMELLPHKILFIDNRKYQINID